MHYSYHLHNTCWFLKCPVSVFSFHILFEDRVSSWETMAIVALQLMEHIRVGTLHSNIYDTIGLGMFAVQDCPGIHTPFGWWKAIGASQDSKVHWANMGPTWVLSAPGEPHVGPMNLIIRVVSGLIPSGDKFPLCRQGSPQDQPTFNLPCWNFTNLILIMDDVLQYICLKTMD